MKIYRLFRMSSTITTLPITLQDVKIARTRIKDAIHCTPVFTSTYLNNLSKHQLFFKCENLQKTGSFKVRGALNAVRNCRKTNPVIVTHSSGNHAQAVAMAAKLSGYESHVVMPKGSLEIKKQAVLGLGAQVSYCENNEQSRQAVADDVMATLGSRGLFISPVNHPDVMAGQGTIALEFLEQVPDLDVIVVSVGGGGLISGICVGAKGIKPSIKVIGAEPLPADDCAKSISTGQLTPNASPPQTVCDALLTSVRELPWSVISVLVDGVVTVTDEETLAAMKLVFERLKLVIEPSAACPLAAVCSPKFQELLGPTSLKVGLVLCGGNVDLSKISQWMT